MTTPTPDRGPSPARALLLGAGLVTPPLVDYLLDHGVQLTIAGNNPQRARDLLAGRMAAVVDWSVDDQAQLARLVSEHDLAISLLPAPMHPRVGQACLAQGKHLVTASYVSPEMQALDDQARAAGLVFLNELGVDPGIDHMSAMRVIDDVERRGGRIRSFRSYCGGLPAPEANDNPWGYKFSWSPLGVLRATTSSARHLERGVERVVPGERLFVETHPLTVAGMGFEAYANRDAIDYVDRYGLSGVETMYRGTLRWPGWAATMRGLRALGLLSPDAPAGSCWAAALAAAAGLRPDAGLRTAVTDHLRGASDASGAALLSVAEVEQVVERLQWLGLLDPDLPPAGATLIEALAALMEQRMAYAAGERDMLVMQHRFVAELGDRGGADAGGEPAVERLTSTMVAYGDPQGHSAMARTVGLPLAIAARMVLEGRVADPGVQIPVRASLYQPILDELEQNGITLAEETER